MLLLRLQSRDTVLSTNVILCLTLKHGTYVTSPTHWVHRACANREDCTGGAASLSVSVNCEIGTKLEHDVTAAQPHTELQEMYENI